VTTIFVTGTGTNVGKTFITAALIRQMQGSGRKVEAIKPLISGFDSGALTASDPGVLLAALGRPLTPSEIDRMAPWRFAAPLSPDLAAAREGRAVDFQALIAFCRSRSLKSPGVVLIEGVGGIMVPLDERRTVLDLMSVLRAPVILVAGSYVGTISHTLTALEVMARRNLDIAAVVVSESEGSAASLEETAAAIAQFADAIDLIALPRLATATSEHAAFAQIAGLISGSF